MSNSETVRSIACAAALFVTAGCGTAVHPGQAGLRYSGWGQGLHQDPKNEGFYFEWPWDDVYVYDITWKSATEDVDVLTADALHVPTRVTVTFRPKRNDLHRFATELGREYYKDVIEPSFVTLTRAEFARYRHNDLAARSPEVEQAVADKLRAAISNKPIEIGRVAVTHIAYDQHVTSAISEKRAAFERVEQKASELRIAEQDAEIMRAASRGRADAVRIEAKAEADAMVAKGEAQARAQDEITKTLSTNYLKYKAFDNDATRYYFVPVGRDGLPIIIGADSSPAPSRPRPNSPALYNYPEAMR